MVQLWTATQEGTAKGEESRRPSAQKLASLTLSRQNVAAQVPSLSLGCGAAPSTQEMSQSGAGHVQVAERP
jgi:hypothetical protein